MISTFFRVICLLLLNCFLMSGCVSSNLSPPESKHEREIVPLCELVNNPGKYDNQEVRTKVIFYEDKFTGFIYSPECVRANQRVAVAFDEKTSGSLHEKLVPLNEILPGGISRASAVITGKFLTKKDKGLGLNNVFNHQIIISDIENVESVPASVPFPWNSK